MITRFNIKLSFLSAPEAAPKLMRNCPEWLEHRFALFEKYCVPSILNQSCRRFHWVLLIDPGTPSPYRKRMEQILKPLRNRVSVLSPKSCFVKAFLSFAQGRSSHAAHLITTRLDNDDAIHEHHIQRVQDSFDAQDYTFVAFAKGYRFSPSTFELRVFPYCKNPFASLIERFSPDSTSIYCGNHAHLHKKGPFIMINDLFGWVQVIHDKNIANRQVGDESNNLAGADVARTLAQFHISLT